MKMWGIGLLVAGLLIFVFGFVLYGEHWFPGQGETEEEKRHPEGADIFAAFAATGTTTFIAGLFVSITALTVRVPTAKWVLIANALLCAVSAPFWLSNNWSPHAPFAMLVFLNAILAPLALPFTLGRWISLRRCTPLPIT